MHVHDFIARWTDSGASERANKDTFLLELCDVLGVPRPDPTTGDRARDRYVFEADAVLTHADRADSLGKVDLYKHGAFVLEAKQGSDTGAAKVGTARRGTGGWVTSMQDAYGQALNYARAASEAPRFLIVADIGHCFDLYACFDGTLQYRPFPDGQNSRIYLAKLGAHLDLLRAIWTDPAALDPARAKVRVTTAIAEHVAKLAATLQGAGHDPELVAKFLMRCLFTMFAEDVGLLPKDVFARQLADTWVPHPESFVDGVSELWTKMNLGGTLYGVPGRILRFNGGLFADARALPLDRAGLEALLAAAKCEWSDVEPAIFGTLLERALSPKERHRLGAHYTPRAYVERLVKPTLEDPLRAEWDLARVAARQLLDAGKTAEARDVVGGFHQALVQTKVLDPACGTGNFLYVALDTLKRLESEVLKLLEDLGDTQALFAPRVSPSQFLGIEKKPWAKEIAELVLWMGYLSWNVRMSGPTVAPKEPVLADYGHIECRDAVLTWDRVEPVLDADGAPVTRWDGETVKIHPVTGNEVPDDTARVPVVRYVNPGAAGWPGADFIVGNPPYLGARTIRGALDHEYLAAVRAAHPEVPENADYVMLWWDHAARLSANSSLIRFGFITTNSVRQAFNRTVLERHVGQSISLVFAIPDHPWVDSADGAAVRVAMTVAESGIRPGTLADITAERVTEGSEFETELRYRVGIIGPGLSIGADPASCPPLRSNRGVCCVGYQLSGRGFAVDGQTAARIDPEFGTPEGLVRPLLSGRDLVQEARGLFAIDAFGQTADSLRDHHPAVYQWLSLNVAPERAVNPRQSVAERWWIFGEPRSTFRPALRGQERMVVTSLTAKHRTFVSVATNVICDSSTVMFALSDTMLLGVLSSRTHVTWALAAGGRLGVGNDPRYNKAKCFDPFPFPDPTPTQRARIADLGERLDAHRKARQALHPDLTLTGMYNVLEKIRAGTPLTDKERAVNEKGLVSLLRELHAELDAAVAEAYGWPAALDDEAILERLVALNAERAAEEKRGLVRWLRPEYQRPLAGEPEPVNAPLPGLDTGEGDTPIAAVAEKLRWMPALSDRIGAVRAVVLRAPGGVSLEAVASTFVKAPRKEVESILDSLAALGIVNRNGAGPDRRWHPLRA